jgi:hypothetical protein
MLAQARDLTVTGAMNVSSNLTVAGALTVTNNLTVAGELNAASNLNVAGVLNLNGATVTGLDASQITVGQLPASVLPQGGTWNAGSLTIASATFQGDGAGLTGLTAAQVGAVAASGGTANNLTVQQALTFGGVARTNWPSGDVFVDLGNTPALDATGTVYSIVLTDDATWDFGTHSAGRTFRLVIAQDENGAWANTWPVDVLWSGGTAPTLSTDPNQIDLLRFVDTGTKWLGLVEGTGFAAPVPASGATYALQFDGSNYASCPGNDFFPSGGLTVEADFATTVYSQWMMGARYTGGFCIFMDSGSLYAGLIYASTYYQVGPVSGSWTDGEWHHVTMSWDGSTLSLSGDGGTPATVGCPGADGYNSGVMAIGSIGDSSAPGAYPIFAGTIDNVVVGNGSSTIASWHFNEGSGTTSADDVNSHTLTLVNSPSWVTGYAPSSQQMNLSRQVNRLSAMRTSVELVTPMTTTVTATNIYNAQGTLLATNIVRSVPVNNP